MRFIEICLNEPDKDVVALADALIPFPGHRVTPTPLPRVELAGKRSPPRLSQLPARIAELPPEHDVILVCHHGSRSQQAAVFLARNGFSRVYNLRGGVEAWAIEVDPAMPRY